MKTKKRESKKKTDLLIEKKSPAEQAEVKAKVKFGKKIITVFVNLARGLVKVWHRNRSFVITEADALELTIDQLNAMADEFEEKEKVDQ